MTQFRIACIYDVHAESPKGRIGWAYWRRCSALQKWAPPDFSVDTFQYADVPWARLGDYHLVYNTEYAAPSRDKIPKHVPLVISFNSDARRRHGMWPNVQRDATFVCFNNYEAFSFYGKPQRSCCISNGCDIELFRPTVAASARRHRLLWCGSTGPTKGKGYAEVFRPLEEIAAKHGFETDFRPINDIKPEVVYGTEDQVAWYNSGSYILCASLSEGTPGTTLEGMACGCVPVSVPVGNILEMGRDRENCVLVDRTPEAFIRGLEYAREHRARLSAAAVETMRGWSYGPPGHRADYFFQLFRRIITDGPDAIQPFAYNEKHWSQI